MVHGHDISQLINCLQGLSMDAIRKAMDFGGGGGGGGGRIDDEDEVRRAKQGKQGLADTRQIDEETLMAMVEGGGEQREKQLLEADFFKVSEKTRLLRAACANLHLPGVWRRL
jgi:hypothetical protein